MSVLLEAQQAFVQNVGLLIAYGVSRGNKFTFGEVWSDDRNHVHMARSLHNVRLALDINLFVDGHWITEDHPEWQALGKFWKSLDVRCRWGGDIHTKVDLNHYSMVPDLADQRI